jgi:hypothetical protein
VVCALQKLSILQNRPENGLLMHIYKERMIRNLKMKEDMDLKRKNENVWGGLYRCCSLDLKSVGDRPYVHDESGYVLLYFSNSMKTLSTVSLLDYNNEDRDIMKLKIIDRLEVIQYFNYCCNVKRYTDEKKSNVPCSECSTLCFTFAQNIHGKKSDVNYILNKLEPSR